MKQVVHILFSFETGGTETMLIDILNLQSQFANITLILINKNIDPKLIEQLNKKIAIVYINRTPKSKSPIPILLLNIKLFTIKPDVIHIHDNTLIPTIVFRRCKKVLTVHCLNQVFDPKQIDVIVSISKAVEEDIWQRLNVKSHLIFNGIKCNEIEVSETEREKNTSFRIVQVGRLAKLKGHEILIKAIDELTKTHKITNIELDIIGGGAHELFLKELVKSLNLDIKIHFLGNKDRSYIYNNLKNYNLLVQPSYEEGFGLTIVEAMVAKTPVLVSNIQAQMEVINFGEFGYYFESGNPSDCASKISQIIESKNLKPTLSARNYAIEKYDISRTVQDYLNIY